MLRWTAAGAVLMPSAVQIRCGTEGLAGLAAGAPALSSPMSADDVVNNLSWFVNRLDPRQTRCTTAVLSDPSDDVDVLSRGVEAAREVGLRRLTVHVPPERVHLAARLGADAVAVPVTSLHAASWKACTVELTAVVPLARERLPELTALAARFVKLRPNRVVFHWPSPVPGAEPPPRYDVLGAPLRVAVAALDAASIAWGVKGLPACALAAMGMSAPEAHAWRTHNRWLVDAQHQLGAALLWFPQVVRAIHVDSCRVCRAASRCDGVALQWLEAGLAGPLEPIGEGDHAAA